MARALLAIKERKLYALLGYSSMTAYGRTVEGLGASTTSELLKIADRCRELPKTREAFERGVLPASKAKVLVSIATPADEADWLERAAKLEPSALRAVGRGNEPEFRQSLKLDHSQMAWVDDAVRVVRETGGPAAFSAAVAEVCRRFVQGEAVGAAKTPGTKRGVRPLLVLTQGEDGVVTRETSRGPVAVREETLEWARQQGKTVDLSQGPPPPAVAFQEGPRRAIPSAIRKHVVARDGGRCVVPGCGRRAYLELDHLDGWKSGHDPDRIITLCWDHHRQRTRGTLRVEEGDETGCLRFYLVDGTYLGLAGDRDRAGLIKRPGALFTDGSLPRDDRSHRPPGAPQPGEERGREFANAKPISLSGRGASHPEEIELALRGMQVLEVKPRDARRLLARALSENPGLGCATAEDLVSAMLRCS